MVAPDKSSARASTGIHSLMLVEDNEDHAQLLVQLLKRGLDTPVISRAADGVEAIARLRREPPFENATRPDLIVLDLDMPKMSGLEVLRHVKCDPALRAIPVVMLTSSDAELDRAMAYDNHVNSYVLKPGDLNQFRDLVTELTHYWGNWNRPAPLG